MNDLFIFTVGQYILVLISGYLMILGISEATKRLNTLINNIYKIKKERIADKLEIKELKEHMKEIDKVEPNGK